MPLKQIRVHKLLPKQAVLKSLLGQVASAIPSHIPSLTLSRQNCFVQLAHGLESVVGISNIVEFEPQKHLQNIFMSAACVEETNKVIAASNTLFIVKMYK
jgi:hypothetical protein